MTISCPFAPWTHAKKTDHNPSFGITLKDNDRSAYKCLSCGVKGRLAGLPTRLGGYRKKDYGKLRLWAEKVEFQAGIFKPTPKWDEADPVTIDCNTTERRAANPSDLLQYPLALGSRYLLGRGIGLWNTLLMGIRYDEHDQRVLFPVYDEDDVFCGVTGRSVLRKTEWTKAYPKVKDYFGLDKRRVFLKLRGRHEGIKLIGEGLFEFANFVRHGYMNARAILGTAVTDEKIEILISAGEPVYFFMDNDLAGWQALFGVFDEDENLVKDNAWAWRLYREIPVWIVPYRRNLDGSDPGGMMSREEIESHIKRAWLFTGKAPLTPDMRPSMLRPRT